MRLYLKLFLISVCLAAILFPLPNYAATAAPKFVIVIDPAHGGTDLGVQYKNKVFEKDITLAVAVFLQKEVGRREGMQILLTRSEDVLLPVKKRIKYVNDQHANMLISIHANGGFGDQSSGFEFYVSGLQEAALTKNDPVNTTLNESIRFAQLIQSELDRILPRKGRGLREAPFTIFNGLSVPAVVAEIGFITNSEDRGALSEQKIRVSIAKAFIKALNAFH